MTQTEALKIAWEALAYINEGANNQGPHTGISWRCAANKSADAITAIKAALVNEALERKAENARELGLDYESGYSTGFMDGAIKAQEANCEPTRCTPNCEALLQKLVAQRKPLIDEDKQRALDIYNSKTERTPLTDEDIRQANHHMVCGAYDYSFKQGVRWAEKVHGIKWEWEA